MKAMCVRDVPDLEHHTVYVTGREYDVDPKSGIAMHFEFREIPKEVFPGYTFNEKVMMLEKIKTEKDLKAERVESLRKQKEALLHDAEIAKLEAEIDALKKGKPLVPPTADEDPGKEDRKEAMRAAASERMKRMWEEKRKAQEMPNESVTNSGLSSDS